MGGGNSLEVALLTLLMRKFCLLSCWFWNMHSDAALLVAMAPVVSQYIYTIQYIDSSYSIRKFRCNVMILGAE